MREFDSISCKYFQLIIFLYYWDPHSKGEKVTEKKLQGLAISEYNIVFPFFTVIIETFIIAL